MLYVRSGACYILKSIKSWADAHAIPAARARWIAKADAASEKKQLCGRATVPSLLEGFVVSGSFSTAVLTVAQLGMTSDCVTRATPAGLTPFHKHAECKGQRLEPPYGCSIVASLVLVFSGLSACH